MAVATMLLSTAAYAYSLDVDQGGRIVSVANGLRFVIQQRTAQVAGRAELRGTSSASRVVASGRLRLVGGGRWVSVMQVLNVSAPGATSGPAEPVTQLGLRPKSGSTTQYEFYIVQGAQPCRGAPTVAVGSTHALSVVANAGDSPEYRIDGVVCKGANPEGDKAGVIYQNGRLEAGRQFYAKLGAYNTLSNQTQQGGGSTIEWTSIKI